MDLTTMFTQIDLIIIAIIVVLAIVSCITYINNLKKETERLKNNNNKHIQELERLWRIELLYNKLKEKVEQDKFSLKKEINYLETVIPVLEDGTPVKTTKLVYDLTGKEKPKLTARRKVGSVYKDVPARFKNIDTSVS